MIRLGLDSAAKAACVMGYVSKHPIRKVFVFAPDRFRVDFAPPCATEHIEYAQIILYRYYYRLLQEIDGDVLLVVNECMRTQNRHDLTYNCLRNFLQQTRHQIIFQRLPIIDDADDFMTLVDLDTRSKWRRQKWDAKAMRGDIDISVAERCVRIESIDIEADTSTQAKYARKKRQLIDGIGLKDPHTIPRNLLLIGGAAKLQHVDTASLYVGRNDRFKLPNLCTYRQVSDVTQRTVFEFCHGFLEFSDFLAVTGQHVIPALVTDLKVDRWYLSRFNQWTERVRDAYAALSE